jgi:hypothetical protein
METYSDEIRILGGGRRRILTYYVVICYATKDAAFITTYKKNLILLLLLLLEWRAPLFPTAHLSPKTTPRAPAPPRQIVSKCREEKQSARTVRQKTLRAKGDKKRRHETREDFSRKEKYMRFAVPRRWEMTVQGPKNKG